MPGSKSRWCENTILQAIYDKLYSAFGPQHWWPARTRTEVIVGAILTQNTAWANVQQAIERLNKADCLTPSALHAIETDRLAELIRPAGTFRVKGKRLKAFIGWLYDTYGGDLDRMFAAGADRLRDELLAVSGIGPETADAILLYAGDMATFVVDAYTQRILRRHFLIEPGATYAEAKDLFEARLASDSAMFAEYHALLVAAGKHYCRPRARCDECPLRKFEHDAAR